MGQDRKSPTGANFPIYLRTESKRQPVAVMRS
ncbi:hypothetical protein V1280_007892 [Bradyrhizobium sp. AZCC 2230]